MSKIRIDQDLHRVVSKWIENWDMDCYVLDFDELVDSIVAQIEYDYEWDELIKADDINLEAYTKDYEK